MVIKTIKLGARNWNLLIRLRKIKGETFDDTVNRLIKKYEVIK